MLSLCSSSIISSVRDGRIFGMICMKGIYGHPIVLPCLIFLFEGELGHLLKQVFDVGRGIPGCHLDDLVQVDLTRIELGQVVLQDGSPPGRIEFADRYDTIKPARAQQGGIQLPNIVGGADQQDIVLVVLEQRDLLEEFIGDGLIHPAAFIPAACESLQIRL